MGLVNNKNFFLRKILVNKFFCYKILSIENLWQKNNKKENFAMKDQNFFTAKFSFGRLHKYYSRLHILKKNLLKIFFFYFLNLLKNLLLFLQISTSKMFFEKFIFSFITSILYQQLVDFSRFYFSITLIRKLFINIFLLIKYYFSLFFFFIFLFLKQRSNRSSIITFESFIDMFLLLINDKNDKQDNSIIDDFVFFKKYEQKKNLFFFNKKIFRSVFFISNLSLFLQY